MNVLLTVLMILSAIGVIVTVLLQEGKSAGLAGSIAGGAEQLLGKQKARGIDALLHRMTTIFAGALFVIAILMGYFM